MPVLDASVFTDALVTAGPPGDRARQAVRGQPILTVPAIFAAEVTSALRGLALRGGLSPRRAAAARRRLARTHLAEYGFESFADRCWELRTTLTVYDAWYVALAERLGTELVTADRRLAGASGPRCPIRAI